MYSCAIILLGSIDFGAAAPEIDLLSLVAAQFLVQLGRKRALALAVLGMILIFTTYSASEAGG